MSNSYSEVIVCVLNETNYLDEILSAMLEAGITNATVVESQGMGRVLTQDMPIFAGFRHLFAGSKPYNFTIFAPIEGPEVRAELLPIIQDVLAEAPADADLGFVFSMPILHFVNLNDRNLKPEDSNKEKSVGSEGEVETPVTGDVEKQENQAASHDKKDVETAESKG